MGIARRIFSSSVCVSYRNFNLEVSAIRSLRANIPETWAVLLIHEQGKSLWARWTYRHLRGHGLRCGLMTDAGPSECPPTVRDRRPLGWRSLLRFSYVCSWKILVPHLDLQDKAIVFSWLPPGDRSRRSEACPRDGKAAAAPNSAVMRIRFSISPHPLSYSAQRRSISLRKNNNNVIWL